MTNKQDILRTEVKMLKATKDIKYLKIAELLGIKTNSFYNWLKCQYNFSEETLNKLTNIVNDLKN